MVLVVGGGSSEKDLGPGPTLTCPNCSNTAIFRVVETAKKATVMFVPVAKWARSFWVVCPICHRGAELDSREIAQDLLASSLQMNADLERKIRELLAPD